jgi:hypothetical protein
MAQRGSTQKTTRFRGPTEVTLRGAGASGNDPLLKGSGLDIGLRIAIPTTQTAQALTIEKPEGTIIYQIDAAGGAAIIPATITAAGAIPVASGSYEITNAGATALTLAAPVAGTQDGMTLTVTSATAFAHTITATGLLQTGSAAVNVATFAAFAGANVTLRAYNGKWQVVSSVGVTFT